MKYTELKSSSKHKGFTLIELVTTMAIITILVTLAIPMVETSVKRNQETQLRRGLRDIRRAIDRYKEFVETNKIKVDISTYNYPPELEILVNGIEYKDKEGKDRIKKFLRKIPTDPMTKSTEWGLRGYEDDPDSEYWDGDNVYDVYSKSELVALDDSYYKNW